MKIVALDGYTLNPGDLDWEQFKALGDFETHDRTPQAQTVERARDAEVVLTNKTVLDRAVIAALPRLRYIGVLATGYNVVDIKAARERGIPVCNVPEYGTANVAQAAFALLLELTNRTGHHAQTVREGRWTAATDFCYWDFPLVELHGLTLGIVGYGRIGQAVGRIGRAFGMKVLVLDASATRISGAEARFVDLDTLFRESDVVSLHCPLTPETKELINAARLAQMKPTAFLINTARGGLVNEAALAAALNHGRLAGAGLDVLSIEPPPADNPLLRANCIITPHIAWATRDARARLMQVAADNLRAWLQGRPQNVVNAAP
ncbi:MAG: D-2-hydroxyacid dehydrogenase [Verrucomicrobiia bacterium]